MDYILDNWGSFVGVLGVIISTGGLIIAFVAMVRAGKARDAASAAEEASRETQGAITRVLNIVDLERAIGLIQRLKVLHRDSKWEASLEHYQTLRAMLADLDARYHLPTSQSRETFRDAILQIKAIEDNADLALRENTEPSDAVGFNEVLNTVQVNLEEIASTTYFPRSEANK